ncbi:hypothetical protein TNIN_257741 [Trichonephila inaurata madagascariensis]|uniref:Uncharacterized protein n=1 Tax=Trichonephila inaurata madagascariensis TaxID=2747483 RepID=A0A8X6X857_9ARAC|nr:hypothetical protein TNIN_257741 [Trichonephila inaurata madagascariensis]
MAAELRRFLMGLGHYNINKRFIAYLKLQSCEFSLVKQFLTHGVDVNYKDNYSNISLHYAVRLDKINIVQEILKAGADPNAVNAQRNTPLHMAVLTGNIRVIQELLLHGADVMAANGIGNIPLHVATIHGKSKVLDLLIKSDKHQIYQKNAGGNAALHLAVVHGKPAAIKCLARHGVDVNQPNEDGNTPLHLGAFHNRANVIKTLVDCGADTNLCNRFGLTPLQLAINLGRIDAAQAFVVVKAFRKTDHVDMSGNTSLHMAAISGNTEEVKALIGFEGYVMRINWEGNTPLHVAAIHGNTSVVEALIHRGADAKHTNMMGHNALHLAVIHRQTAVIETLIRCGAFIDSRTGKRYTVTFDGPKSPEVGFMNQVKPVRYTELRDEFGNQAESYEGNTSLHIAAVFGHLEVIETLIQHAADVDFKNKEGNTPLHIAAIHDKVDVIEILLNAGADINSVNIKRITPLHSAAIFFKQNSIEKLIQSGANIDHNGFGRGLALSMALYCCKAIHLDELNRKSSMRIAESSPNEFRLYPFEKYDVSQVFASTKILIKYHVLKWGGWSCVNQWNELENESTYSELQLFVKDCCSEVNFMESKSFYESVVSNVFVPTDEDFDETTPCNYVQEFVLDLLLSGECPIYRDLILPYMDKKTVQKKLSKLIIYVKGSKQDIIALNHLTMSILSDYLSNIDIFNLIRAFTYGRCNALKY